MTYQPDPGTTLAATDAMRSGQETYTCDQVAYLLQLAFLSGAGHRNAMDTAEMVAQWSIHTTPLATSAQRKAQRLEVYAATIGPATYMGGPVDWETGLPVQPTQDAA